MIIEDEDMESPARRLAERDRVEPDDMVTIALLEMGERDGMSVTTWRDLTRTYGRLRAARRPSLDAALFF